MILSIRHQGHETQLDVEEPATLHDVKALIWSVTGVPMESQRLFGIPSQLCDADPVPRGRDGVVRVLVTQRSNSPVPEGEDPPAFVEDMEQYQPRFDALHDEEEPDDEDPFFQSYNPYASAGAPVRAPATPPHQPPRDVVDFETVGDNPDDAGLCALLYSASPYSNEDLSHAFSAARREHKLCVVVMLNEAQRSSQNLAAIWGTTAELQQILQRAVIWVCEVHNNAAMSTFGEIACRIPDLQNELPFHIRGGILQSPSIFVFQPGSQGNRMLLAEYGCDSSALHHVALVVNEQETDEVPNRAPEAAHAPTDTSERAAERYTIRSEYEAALEEDRRRDEEERRRLEELRVEEALEQTKREAAAALVTLQVPEGGIATLIRGRDGTQTTLRLPPSVSVAKLLEYAFGLDPQARAISDVQVCTTHPRVVYHALEGSTSHLPTLGDLAGSASTTRLAFVLESCRRE